MTNDAILDIERGHVVIANYNNMFFIVENIISVNYTHDEDIWENIMERTGGVTTICPTSSLVSGNAFYLERDGENGMARVGPMLSTGLDIFNDDEALDISCRIVTYSSMREVLDGANQVQIRHPVRTSLGAEPLAMCFTIRSAGALERSKVVLAFSIRLNKKDWWMF